MSNNVVQQLATTAFGDIKTESMEPVFQISAHYGLLNNILTVVDNAASGTSTIVDGMYTVQTGASATGLASILTLRQLAYRAGQGALARLTGKFSAGVANSNQLAGLITAENIYAFGYLNDNFGIVYGHDGMGELQELTLSVAAAAAETATVTIDGAPYVVALTGGSTVINDAYELSQSLNTQVPNYTFTSNNSTVVAQAVISGAQGAFAYSSTGTSAGAWVQDAPGVDVVIEFIPQANWNIDTRTSADADANLDPTKGNVYQVQYQYLGFGAINFFVEDSDSGDVVLVHRIKYANKNDAPSVSTPTFRAGWLVRNTGNTTNITVQGGSAALFIEGDIKLHTLPRTIFEDALSIGSTLTNLATTRNRISFAGKINRAELMPLLASISTQSNRLALFKIILNPVFAVPVDYEYVDKLNSITEVTTDHVAIIGGNELASFVVVDGNSVNFIMSDLGDLVLFPGETLCMAVIIPTGAASDCQAALTWQEDL